MSNTLLLEGRLLLDSFSQQAPQEVSEYESLKAIDLVHVEQIDSAGLAYLIQIKMHYPTLLLINASNKLRVLAELYGVENLLEK